jgi:death-on-curing protein
MTNLTVDDLIHINNIIQQYFGIRTGIEKHGLLSSAVERPDQVYHTKIMYPDIYTKAASLFEAIARWHMFSDLNKRTALIATRAFLDINDHLFFVPLNAVRFSVEVAKNQNTEDQYTQKLILKIAHWIEKHSAHKDNLKAILQMMKMNAKEQRLVFILARLKLMPLVKMIFNRWLAIDIYPEYEMSAKQILRFLYDIRQQNVNEINQIIHQIEARRNE